VLHGIKVKVSCDFIQRLDKVRQFDGRRLGVCLINEIKREHDRLLLIGEQLKGALCAPNAHRHKP
jgi:hypothetical protein